MVLHYLGVRPIADFKNGFAKEELVRIGKTIIYCQIVPNDQKVEEPCIWIQIKNKYDVWQLQNQAISKRENTYQELQRMCTSLYKKLYQEGFHNGNFEE